MQSLSGRYSIAFTSVGCNLYRDGSDSVGWHGDRVAVQASRTCRAGGTSS